MRRPIVAFALWTLIMPHIGAAQPTCPPVVSDLSHTATLSVTNPSNTCTATDGDYIKTNTTYKLHVNAAVAGSCQTYTWQGGCIPAWLYKHTAVRTDQSVTSYASTLTVLGALNVQSYNTCTNANGTGNCTAVGTLQTGRFVDGADTCRVCVLGRECGWRRHDWSRPMQYDSLLPIGQFYYATCRNLRPTVGTL
jgi:hypothetical protein